MAYQQSQFRNTMMDNAPACSIIDRGQIHYLDYRWRDYWTDESIISHCRQLTAIDHDQAVVRFCWHCGGHKDYGCSDPKLHLTVTLYNRGKEMHPAHHVYPMGLQLPDRLTSHQITQMTNAASVCLASMAEKQLDPRLPGGPRVDPYVGRFYTPEIDHRGAPLQAGAVANCSALSTPVPQGQPQPQIGRAAHQECQAPAPMPAPNAQQPPGALDPQILQQLQGILRPEIFQQLQGLQQPAVAQPNQALQEIPNAHQAAAQPIQQSPAPAQQPQSSIPDLIEQVEVLRRQTTARDAQEVTTAQQAIALTRPLHSASAAPTIKAASSRASTVKIPWDYYKRIRARENAFRANNPGVEPGPDDIYSMSGKSLDLRLTAFSRGSRSRSNTPVVLNDRAAADLAAYQAEPVRQWLGTISEGSEEGSEHPSDKIDWEDNETEEMWSMMKQKGEFAYSNGSDGDDLYDGDTA